MHTLNPLRARRVAVALVGVALMACSLFTAAFPPTPTAPSPPAAPSTPTPPPVASSTLPAATPTAVALDLCSLLTTEEVGDVLGTAVTSTSGLGLANCTYTPSAGGTASVSVSAAQGDDARGLVLAGVQLAFIFGGPEELTAELQALTEAAPELPLWDLVERAYGLLAKVGLQVEPAPEAGEHALWIWAEQMGYATLLVVRDDTYLAFNVTGLQPETARAAALRWLPLAWERLPARFTVPTSMDISIEMTVEPQSSSGAVWVALANEGRVVKLDPITGQVVARLEVGAGPADLAAAPEGIFVACQRDGTIWRLDRDGERAEQMTQVESGGYLRVDVDQRYLYAAACGEGLVRVYDRQSGMSPVTDLELEGCWNAEAAEGALWVPVGEDQVQRFALDSWQRRAMLRIGSGPGLIEGYRGFIWVGAVNRKGVWRIDPAGNSIAGVTPIETHGNLTAMAAGEGALWVAVPEGVVKVDAETGEVEAVVETDTTPSGVAAGLGYLWVTHYGEGTVERYDLDTLEYVDALAVGNGPWAILITD